MSITDIVERLDLLSTAPSDKAAFENWLKVHDAIAFLKDNARDSEFVVYASLAHTFMHTLLVPAALVNPPDTEDLMEWSLDPTTCWSVCQGFSPPRIWVTPPLDRTGSKTLDQGEQLVFYRFFERRPDETSYFEVLQKFTQIFDLHFIPERNAYCRFNRLGDFEDLIRIVRIPTKGARMGGRVRSLSMKVRQSASEFSVAPAAARA